MKSYDLIFVAEFKSKMQKKSRAGVAVRNIQSSTQLAADSLSMCCGPGTEASRRLVALEGELAVLQEHHKCCVMKQRRDMKQIGFQINPVRLVVRCGCCCCCCCS